MRATCVLLAGLLILGSAPDAQASDWGEALCDRASEAFLDRRPAEAVTLFDGCIEAIGLDDSRLPSILIGRALARDYAGDVDGAMADFDRAVALTPGNPAARFARGQYRFLAHDYEGAAADMVAVVRQWSTAAAIFIERERVRRLFAVSLALGPEQNIAAAEADEASDGSAVWREGVHREAVGACWRGEWRYAYGEFLLALSHDRWDKELFAVPEHDLYGLPQRCTFIGGRQSGEVALSTERLFGLVSEAWLFLDQGRADLAVAKLARELEESGANHLRYAQWRLGELGYDAGPVDGKMTARLQAALAACLADGCPLAVQK